MNVMVILFVGCIVFCCLNFYVKHEKEEWLSLDVCLPIRGLCCCVVVLGHIWNYNSKLKIENLCFSFLIASGFLMVGTFFLFSGYGTVTNYFGKENKLSKCICKKIISLFIPYWTANILFVLCYKLINTDMSIKYILASFVLPILNWNAWYVFSAFINFFVFIICTKITKNKKIMLCLQIVWIGIYVSICILTKLGTWWYISTGAYLIGILVGLYKDEMKIILSNKLVILLITILFIVTYSFTPLSTYIEINSIIFLILQYLACITFALVICSFSMYLGVRKTIFEPIGVVSYEIYLIHGCVKNVVHYFDLNISNVIIIIIIIFLTYAVAILFEKINKKLKNYIGKLLC